MARAKTSAPLAAADPRSVIEPLDR
jgi:hypothetical protein